MKLVRHHVSLTSEDRFVMDKRAQSGWRIRLYDEFFYQSSQDYRVAAILAPHKFSTQQALLAALNARLIRPVSQQVTVKNIYIVPNLYLMIIQSKAKRTWVIRSTYDKNSLNDKKIHLSNTIAKAFQDVSFPTLHSAQSELNEAINYYDQASKSDRDKASSLHLV